MSAMHDLHFPEPPTQTTLADARRDLLQHQAEAAKLSAKIHDAEQELERIMRESRCAIEDLEQERAAIEDRVARTLAYLSPIRRLPPELLGQIFTFIFEDLPCCAWVLSAVCSLWRQKVLSMPKLWSKIRLVTTQNSSPDTVRLWLERSGSTVPLDIEIFLHATNSRTPETPYLRRRRSSGTIATVGPWDAPMLNEWDAVTQGPLDGTGPGGGPPYIPVPVHFATVAFSHHHGSALGLTGGHGGAASVPITEYVPPLSTWRQINQSTRSRGSMHWGHIAFYYLTEQMHRWSRFVFRFDRQFSSINALKSITGDAPLLKELEISSAEPIPSADWSWLPSASSTANHDLQSIETLTLQYVPFKSSSPIFRNLRSLSLRTLPTNAVPLHRVLSILKASPALESLSLHINTVTHPVLPLVPTTFTTLKHFTIGGHYLLSGLLDCLSLPGLESLVFDVDARDSPEEAILSLIQRSNHPPLTKFSLLYGNGSNPPSGIYYGAGSVVASWHFLAEMDDLETLQVGGAHLDALLSMLCAPEDDTPDQWICPNLTSLSIRSCHAHADGIAKLVQMVEARNPDPASGATPLSVSGVAPVKLRHLEVHDCTLGSDVAKWLDGRVDDVVCVEPVFDGPPGSPGYHFIG